MKKGNFKSGILGAAVGVVAGLLFAPKSGTKTRGDLKKLANKKATEAEKTLKKSLVRFEAEKKKLDEKYKNSRGKAKEELKELLVKADIAQKKLKETITAVREGEADTTSVKKAEDNAEKIVKTIEKKLKPSKK